VVKEIADNAGGSALTAGAIADAVWDEVLSGHLTAGTTGAGLNAAGSAGDPWSTALPGAYGAGTAGKIVGDNINAPIATVDTVVDALAVQLALVPKSTGSDTFNATCVGNIKSGLSTQAELDLVPKSSGNTTWNATALASINTQADLALTDYDPPTRAELTSDISSVITQVDANETKIDTMQGNVTTILSDTNDLQTQVGTAGAGLTSLPAVTLANGAHGGAAATITAKSISVTNSDAGGIAVTLTGSGTGNSHALSLASTSGSAISAVAGSHGVNVVSTAGKGLIVSGATGDIDADIAGTIDTCTTNTDMLTAAAVNAEVDTALNTAMPANPVAKSPLDYIKRLKFAHFIARLTTCQLCN